jgi:uncharacterized coiled-coil protein SlyX
MVLFDAMFTTQPSKTANECLKEREATIQSQQTAIMNQRREMERMRQQLDAMNTAYSATAHHTASPGHTPQSGPNVTLSSDRQTHEVRSEDSMPYAQPSEYAQYGAESFGTAQVPQPDYQPQAHEAPEQAMPDTYPGSDAEMPEVGASAAGAPDSQSKLDARMRELEARFSEQLRVSTDHAEFSRIAAHVLAGKGAGSGAGFS